MNIKGKKTLIKSQAGKLLVEHGELYKDANGNIVESDSFSHDDPLRIDEQGDIIKVRKGTGGEVVDAESAVSASYDQVKTGDRKDNKKEKLLRFKPKESNSILAERLPWFKTGKTLSPAQLIKEASEQTSKYAGKFNKKYADDEYGRNSMQKNAEQLAALPDDEEIYDLVLSAQEFKKNASGVNFDETVKAQSGSTSVARPLKFGRPLTQLEINDKFINKDKDPDYFARMYVNDKYPDITVANNIEDDRADFQPFSKTINVHPGNNSDVSAELAHVQQMRKSGTVPFIKRGLNDIAKQKVDGKSVYDAQNETYDVKGSMENEAHRVLEKPIEDDFYEFRKNIQYQEFVQDQLKHDLGRIKKKQSGGTPESMNGLYDYPNQEVVVPDNNITMNGIDYPVDAFDNETGEFLETMQPNQQYKFDGVNKVLEIPKAASGTANDVYNEKLRYYMDRMKRTSDPGRRAALQKDVDQLAAYYGEQDEYVGTPWNPLEKPIVGSKYPNPKALTSREPTLRSINTPIAKPINQKSSGRKSWDIGKYNPEAMDNGVYTVGKGDWISSIAASNGMTTQDLIAANPQLKDVNKIKIGDKINIPGARKVAQPEEVNVDEIEYTQMQSGGYAKMQSAGYNNTNVVPNKYIKVQGTNAMLDPTPDANGNYVDQTGAVWKKSGNSFVPTGQKGTPVSRTQPTTYSEYLEKPTDQYTVRKGDWASSVAPMFGLTTDEFVDLNPQLADPNKIEIGQKLNIRRPSPVSTPPFIPSGEPVDRMSEVDNLQELPEELDVTAEDVIPTLDVQAENVAPNTISAKPIVDAATTLLGKINRNRSMFGLEAMQAANRVISPSYRQDVPFRTIKYNEEDVTPYLDEIDSAANQQIANVNANTSQGQAILSNIRNQSLASKRQIQNRISSVNLQRRAQVDKANVQLLNQSDILQERSNQAYVEDTQRALAANDASKIATAQYLDQLVDSRTRQDNEILYNNARNPDYQVGPDGSITVRNFKFKDPTKKDKAKYGMFKKKS